MVVHRPSLGPRWGRAEPADEGRDGGRGGPPGTTASCAPCTHVPNMYQRYKLAFSELNENITLPSIETLRVFEWDGCRCQVHLYPQVTHFQGPVPRVLAGAPAIPPEWSGPPLPPPQIPRRAAPTSLQCSCATPARSDQDSPLFLAMWVCARKIALHVPFRGARDKR